MAGIDFRTVQRELELGRPVAVMTKQKGSGDQLARRQRLAELLAVAVALLSSLRSARWQCVGEREALLASLWKAWPLASWGRRSCWRNGCCDCSAHCGQPRNGRRGCRGDVRCWRCSWSGHTWLPPYGMSPDGLEARLPLCNSARTSHPEPAVQSAVFWQECPLRLAL